MQRPGAVGAHGMSMGRGLRMSEAESSGRGTAGGLSPCCSQRGSNSNPNSRLQR